MLELFVNCMIGVTGVLAVLCVLSYLEARDPPRIRIDQPPHLPENPPLISVIVPARNEEENIPHCLESLQQQDYPNFEVIVVNDRSKDRTGSIVEAFARRDPRVKPVNGERLKDGWLGKSHALHQGVQVARGDWLLFVDADTWHHPQSLSASMDHVLRENVDMLSLYPHFVCKSFWEKVIQPAVGRMILIAGPLTFVNSRKPISRIFYMAIGQFILVRKNVYEAVGGHAAIRERVTEDVELAKRVKGAGYALNFLYGFDVLHTRMYTTFSELWRGWSRSFYPAMGNNLPQAVLETVLVFIFGTLPYLSLPIVSILLLMGFSSEPIRLLFILGLIQYTLLFTTTYVVRRQLREYPNYFFTCPLGGILVQWISTYSVYMYVSKKKVLWKDRNLNA